MEKRRRSYKTGHFHNLVHSVHPETFQDWAGINFLQCEEEETFVRTGNPVHSLEMYRVSVLSSFLLPFLVINIQDPDRSVSACAFPRGKGVESGPGYSF
jgi:hypothetical protein